MMLRAAIVLQKFGARLFIPIILLLCLVAGASHSAAQTSTGGAITVTVTDPAGATVPGASLELRNAETNDLHKAETQSNGTYTFPNLLFGTYRLTITKAGFQTDLFAEVQVQTARITDVNASLKVGGTTQTVQVTDTAAPLVEADSSVLSDTIDTKQVTNLPMLSRNVMQLAFLVPGWSSSGGPQSTTGTWNNMPGGAVVAADFDGTPGISNRFRSGGFAYGTTAVQPRIEDVAEMSIQTGQLDLGGVGTSAMGIHIVTRHGTNTFHGRLFEDFRNTDLNANSWLNNARNLPRTIIKLNDFGGSLGGPIIKNKLFIFGTWAQSLQPSTAVATANVLSPSAQQGLFQYKNSAGTLQTVDLMQMAGAAGYANTVLPLQASQFSKINGVLNQGTLTPTSDPNISTFSFLNTSSATTYYPTVRADYNLSDNVRINLSYGMTKTVRPGVNPPIFPGGIDPVDHTSSNSKNQLAGFGVDWTLRPNMINQFHLGYMYQYSVFDPENNGLDLTKIIEQGWSYGTSLYNGTYPRQFISSFYPLLSANDSFNWQHGSHSFSFGGAYSHEQDHYWNGPAGYPSETLGISAQDPIASVFTSGLAGVSTTNLTNAENLYAELTGRISAVAIAGGGRPLNPKTKQYDPFGAYILDEAQASGGLWAQDRWKLRPNLTLNYGLRFDIVGDDHDVAGGYTAFKTVADLWGPTTVGQMFAPGALNGVQNPQIQGTVHVYHTGYEPSPAVALAWSPTSDKGFLGKLLGKDKTVVRVGYSLRHYQEGAQNFWAFATNGGQIIFQQGTLTSNSTPAVGNFTPGSLTVGQTLPPYFLTPASYSPSLPASSLFGSTFYGMNPNIRQPYVEQWNFGIQRQLGPGSAIEIRYVGNLSLHQWLAYNLNEYNTLTNGFTTQFVAAQNNLKINQANGKGASFANNGLGGQSPLPIFEAAFGTATSNFTNGTFITDLNTGQAGLFARSIAQNATFLCNMVGSANLSPGCAAKGVPNAPGAGYPINFFQVNPIATGAQVNYLDSSGSSNYNALQMDFRQRLNNGMQFNVNYTWSHSLGIAAQNQIQGQGNNIYYTAHDFRLNYSPMLFDIRQVVHASGTYDLPFGKGRKYLNQNRFTDYTIGGWTLGTIIALQGGTPNILAGGYDTLNFSDSGVILNNGATTQQLQSSVGQYKSGNPWVYGLNPATYVASNGVASSSSLSPNTNPGTFAYRPFIYSPGWYNIDLSINKSIPIREKLHFTVQAELLNATNHPTFNFASNSNSLAIQSTSFGQMTSGATAPRVIELRANIVF
jgi:carboxypeptidase family protein